MAPRMELQDSLSVGMTNAVITMKGLMTKDKRKYLL